MYGQLKRLAGQSFIYTAGDILNRALAFLLLPLYTAFLTPADYGILAITNTVAAILSILYLQSLESALTRFHYDYMDDKSRRDFYGTIWILMIGSSLIASLLTEAIGGPITGLILQEIPYTPYIRLVVWTTFLSNSSILLLRAVLRVHEKPVSFVALNVGTFLLNTVLIMYFVVAKKQGALGSLRGHFLATLILAIPVTIAFLKRANLSWSWSRSKASLSFALPLVPHLLSLWVLNLSDRIILQKYVPLTAVGIYSLGYQVASIVGLLASSAMNAWSPFFYKTADENGAQVMLSRFSTYYWLAVAVFGTGVAVLARDVLVVMASRPAYHIAYQVVPWVVLGFVMRAYYFVFMTALYHTKQVKAVPLVTVVSGLLNVGLNVLLVPRYGYLVAAVTTFGAYAFQAIVMYVLAQRAYPMPYEYVRITKIMAVGVGLFLVAATLPLAAGWSSLAIKTALLATFPVALTLLGFWTADETAVFRRLSRRARGYLERHVCRTM